MRFQSDFLFVYIPGVFECKFDFWAPSPTFDPVFAVTVLILFFNYQCDVQHFALRSRQLGPGSSFAGNAWIYVHIFIPGAYPYFVLEQSISCLV